MGCGKREYTRRVVAGGTCKHGHRLTPENTIEDKCGRVRCRDCQRASQRRHYAKRAAALDPHILRGVAPEYRERIASLGLPATGVV